MAASMRRSADYREWLEANRIPGLVDELIGGMLADRPRDPLAFIQQWTLRKKRAEINAPGLRLKMHIDDVFPIRGRKVFVRVDFNVPMQGGQITNDFRIRAALGTIKKVITAGGRLILASHMGRPKGTGHEAEYSLKACRDRLSELLGRPVSFAPDCMNAENEVASLKDGDCLLLENLRFYKFEGAKKEADRQPMAEKLASYCDIFVCDAFGTAHRDAASITGVPKFMGHGVAGDLMAKEINCFGKALSCPDKPVVAIVGGSKVSSKILVLENLLSKCDTILIGGAMAYTFLAARGGKTGGSMVEKEAEEKGKKVDLLQYCNDLMAKADRMKCSVLLPVDHTCHTKFESTPTPLVTADADIPDGYMALDIGPKTSKIYCDAIKTSRTAIWNGPMGVFEKEPYNKHTFAIAKALGENPNCMSIVGGGDSVAAVELSGYADKVAHVSTGGGASLELMEGRTLPGIAALSDK
eukprot:TRINITY_DN17560_c0_g1_i1.p1 TRINITY_DN17560_c0_g1~~TRINITY_DN17560_c0_g1_i1.p1  ORF type:complete len:507 (+),score=185.59 TRINITY_DN17560_c0_g1_i1:115-1521(+)